MKCLLLLFSLFNCGIFCYGFNEDRIWNGSIASTYKYPDVVRFRGVFLNMNESAAAPNVQMNLCTGTVISARHILTAGQCVKTYKIIDAEKKAIKTLPMHAFIVEFGDIDIKFVEYANLSKHGITMEAKTKGFDYKNPTKDDIAIIEFPEGYDLKIPPVVLAKNYVEDGSDIGTSVGFGRLGPIYPKTSITTILNYAVNITILKECKANTSVNHVMCAGNMTYHADQGDFGGPLFLTRGNQRYQIGIAQSVANINGSSPGEFPEINLFTRVSDYCDWIEEITQVKCEEMPLRPPPPPTTTYLPSGSDAILKNTLIVLFASVLNVALFA